MQDPCVLCVLCWTRMRGEEGRKADHSCLAHGSTLKYLRYLVFKWLFNKVVIKLLGVQEL